MLLLPLQLYAVILNPQFISQYIVAMDLNSKSFFNLYHYDKLRPQWWEENVASRSDVAVAAVRLFQTHFPVAVRFCLENWLLLEGFWSGRVGTRRESIYRVFKIFLSVPVFLFEGHFLYIFYIFLNILLSSYNFKHFPLFRCRNFKLVKDLLQT